MRPEFRRRTVLATTAAAMGSALAGCSGGSDDDSTPDPDEGTDSYGIHLRNRAGETHEVTITATYSWEDETPFEETVEVDPGETRTWNEVVTDEVEHTVEGSIGTGNGHRSSHIFVTPGGETAPSDENVQVRVQNKEVKEGDFASVAVYFESRREDR